MTVQWERVSAAQVVCNYVSLLIDTTLVPPDPGKLVRSHHEVYTEPDLYVNSMSGSVVIGATGTSPDTSFREALRKLTHPH